MKQKDVSLFPYFLLRIANGPYPALNKLNLTSTIKIIHGLDKLNQEDTVIKEKLSLELYEMISKSTDQSVRKLLINARRDIYNERPIDYLPKEIEDNFSLSLKKLLKRYRKQLINKNLLYAQGEKYYDKELKIIKKNFIKLLEGNDFQKGLLLSSEAIWESMNKYINFEKTTGKNFTKIENNLLKYLSRMYAKTSPFSTFTYVALGKLEKINNTKDQLIFHKEARTLHSRIQLNQLLYHNLIVLLQQNREIRNNFELILNLTLRKIDNHFVFLTNQNSQESFQKVTITPALEFIYTLIQTKKNWSYHELVTEIINQNKIIASKKDIEDYLDQLINSGFLEYEISLLGSDLDWENKLNKKLQPLALKFSTIKDLLTTLSTIKELAYYYQSSSLKKRKEILHNAFTLYKNLYYRLFASVDKRLSKDSTFTFKPHQLWYEDTFTTTQFTISKKITKNLESLGDFLRRMDKFDSCVEEKLRIEQFFKKKYGTKARINLLQFYEDYSREEKKFLNTESHLIKISRVREKRKQNKEVLKTLIKQLSNQLESTEINISKNNLAHVPYTEPASFSCFFQIYGNQTDPMLVINSAEGGYGRRWSRFLYLFPQQITTALRTWNNKRAEDMLFAEPLDTSAFNANFHPRLMPYEIHTPGGDTSLPETHIIKVTDIDVVYNTFDHCLQLIDKKSNKRVIVFDLAFQNPISRSDLYWFLSLFSDGEHHQPYPVIHSINNAIIKKMPEKKIITLPRITYERCVVLQRKTWKISPTILPIRDVNENDWSYFCKVFHWKDTHEIPEEVFITIDEEKPQFINFTNPLLVKLFEKLTRTVTETIMVQEMLPSSKHLAVINRNQRVTEFMAQWYC